MWESFKDIFQWQWYDEYRSSFGITYQTGLVTGDDGEPNGDLVTMVEIGLILGGLTIFIEYIPAD